MEKRTLLKSAQNHEHSGWAGDQNGKVPLLFGTTVAIRIKVDIDKITAKGRGNIHTMKI
jgi:hypothetical protein